MALLSFIVAACTLGFCTTAAATTSSTTYPSTFTPIGIATGTVPIAEATKVPVTISLQKLGDILTLDYGKEVAGYPFFTVSSLSNPIQLEIKYTEQFAGLGDVWSDGPYYFAAGLTNTFRVETFNVTATGRYESFFIQGGQRWESVKLLTQGQVTFSELGLRATIDFVDLDELPSSFNCSNVLYNRIWKLGAGAATAACVDAGTQTTTWELTKDGAYIRGQKPTYSALGTEFSNYTLSFDAKIDKGGIGWAVGASGLSGGLGFLLISELPEASTFVNTNRSLTPASTLVVNYGWGPVNQTSLGSVLIGHFSVPFKILENEWYTIATSLKDDRIAVSVSGTTVLNASFSDYSWAGLSASAVAGSFGFGGWQDMNGYYTNVKVYSENGTQIYSNNLLSEEAPLEYGVATNVNTACLDGAKRDRLVWLGDFYHTSRIIPASTSRWDHVTGTLNTFLDSQAPDGAFDVAANLGYGLNFTSLVSPPLYELLGDYQILGALAFVGYFERTGDMAFATKTWTRFKKHITYLIDQIDPTTNLVSIGIFGFIGPSYGTAVSAAFVQALNGAATIADALSHHFLAISYRATAARVAAAINELLWNEDLQVYTISPSDMSDFSVADLSFAITSGVANATRAKTSLRALTNVTLAPGYKDSTAVSDAGAVISPFLNGVLLSAAMEANDTAPVKYLLNHLWAAMVQNNRYYSGASWEYVGQDLSPGLGLFTSLSHPWGGAPTYVLPEYVAGLRPTTPGYKTWLVIPAYEGFGLSYASASVKTRYGQLSVTWRLSGHELIIDVDAPKGTSGSVQLPGGKLLEIVTIGSEKMTVGTAMDVQEGTSHVVLSI